MDAVAEFLRRIPAEIDRAGGSLPWRAGLLGLALLVNIGFYLPSLPEGTPGAGTPGLDKAVHLLVFALTVFAAGRLLAPRRRFPIGWVALVALVHAVVIELVQLVAMPDRSADVADVLFDAVGIALGLALWAGERVLRRAAAEREVVNSALPEERVR
jgi:VanZ family protein